MSKHIKAILVAIALLLVSSVTAREKPLAEAIEDCEETVRGLNALSETIDRMSDENHMVYLNASEALQKGFVSWLSAAQKCAKELSKRTGKKYKISKDWFGYALKKP